jgi:RimJ/RimL family protein N-acetyltransferase
VRWVVTEWGSAYLHGTSTRERAISLIDLAHPDHRDALLAEAIDTGLLPAKQKLRSHAAYPDHEIQTLQLRDGRPVVVRPTHPSDSQLLKRLFHRLPPEDVYTRFFRQMKSLSTTMAEHMCGQSYDHQMAFVAVTGDAERERAVATASYFLMPETGLADAAYIVDPDYAGCGLGTALQGLLVDYARRQGIRGFHADVLAENASMLAVLRRADAEVTVSAADDGAVEVRQIFRSGVMDRPTNVANP